MSATGKGLHMSKFVMIKDFLTHEEIKKCTRLATAKEICEKVIRPNIDRINKALGQENDPMYIAYAVKYGIGRHIE